jgi:hypothetical protein
LRSEESHVLAMLAPLAFVVAAAIAGLRRADGHLASALALVLVLLPALAALRPAHFARLIGDAEGRARAFATHAARVEPVGGRVGYRFDLAAPYSVFSALPLGEFLTIANQLHEKVGARPVVVASAIGNRGHWYFFADLVPATADPEPMQTIHNSRLRARYLAELAARGIPCVISMQPGDAEVELFRRQPGEREESIVPTSAGNFYVGCLRASSAQPSAATSPGSSARSPIT